LIPVYVYVAILRNEILESSNHLDLIYDLQFEKMSEDPNYWHNKSCHLKESSKVLWDVWSQGYSSDCGDTYRMLMGMSFELLFKSFLVAKEMDIKATHNLIELAGLAGFELDEKESHIFKNLTGYIYWEGKYPVPKPIDTKRKQVTGGEGIKLQREAFVPACSEGLNILKNQPGKPALLNSDDLDYDNLLKLWMKFNGINVAEYIAT